jgi:phosphatidylserine/phosphatidylglycerophosphate/cardiolipin synthase-like enzyme
MASSSAIVKKSSAGLHVTSYRGSNAVLFAMDMDKAETSNLAGFSIHCIAPTKGPYPTREHCLPNDLDFEHPFESDNVLNCTNPRGSNHRPFQTFHWMHFPSAGTGEYKYTIYAAYFDRGRIIHPYPGVTFDLNIDSKFSFPSFDLGFTRAYVSSQAYVERYGNTPVYPQPKSLDFDTKEYLEKYLWLGASARDLIFKILEETQQDDSIELDVFSFDLSEPDIVRALCNIGKRLRIFQDNSTKHKDPKSLESEAVKRIRKSGAKVQRGHFQVLAHDKVFIQKKNGKPTSVLTGSANFSLRGIYVQANSVLVFRDSAVAELYERAFEQAFTDEKKFSSSPIASKWYDVEETTTIPHVAVSFAPHKTPAKGVPFSLNAISEAIQSAKTSVFYAIMAPKGEGPAISGLKTLAENDKLFSLGIVDKQSQIDLFKGGSNAGTTAYSRLTKYAPEPFKQELSSLEKEGRGFTGVVIHHKFVVCDFNDQKPVVFCGSSNLARGGEAKNGDNLIAIHDQEIAVAYAVEAIRLYDHYRFRSLEKSEEDKMPVKLKETDGWVKPYYDPTNIKFRERKLLAAQDNTA